MCSLCPLEFVSLQMHTSLHLSSPPTHTSPQASPPHTHHLNRSPPTHIISTFSPHTHHLSSVPPSFITSSRTLHITSHPLQDNPFIIFTLQAEHTFEVYRWHSFTHIVEGVPLTLIAMNCLFFLNTVVFFPLLFFFLALQSIFYCHITY